MTAIPTGRFVWFEYVAKDVERAKGFFGELFGWTTKPMPFPGSEYTLIEHDGASLGGYLPTPEGASPHPHWLSHLQVASAADAAAKVKSLGGRVAKEPIQMGDYGTMAVALDPTGAVFALWQPGQPEGTGDFRGKPGTFCWNELWTSDPTSAVDFYKGLGGFTSDAMEMPGMGTYTVLNHEGKPRGGIMKSALPKVPNMWLPYVQVASADDTAARAGKLGATIHVPATDIPNVGRFSVFTDPLGGALGILQPSA